MTSSLALLALLNMMSVAARAQGTVTVTVTKSAVSVGGTGSPVSAPGTVTGVVLHLTSVREGLNCGGIAAPTAGVGRRC